MPLDQILHHANDAAVATSFKDTSDSYQLVDYYATSCPHCQHLKPEWDSAKSAWSSQNMGDNVEWVNKECLNDKWQPGPDIDDCRTAGIQGFPTVRLEHLQDGKIVGDPVDYTGNRTSEDIIQFVKDNTSGAGTALPDDASGKEAAMPLFVLALPESNGEILKVPRCRRDFF